MRSTDRTNLLRLVAISGLLALLAGCGGGELMMDAGAAATQPDAGVDVPDSGPVLAVAPMKGDLLIEEFYYCGAPPAGGADHYFSDQFVELVNAAEHPLDLSGVLLGDAFGIAGAINPGSTPNSYAESRPDEVVLTSVWRIPAGARLEPGERLVVAHDGTNHRPFSDVDLSGVAYEAYVESSGRDEDHPTVANLESVLFNGGADWLVPVFGASIVVLAADTTFETVAGPFGDLAAAPATSVLDAIEALMDGDSAAFKRLPPSVDTGFAFVSDTYAGESLHRRRVDDVWQDTDDSGADFAVGPPDPVPPPAPEPVTGQPWIELGTGRTAYASVEDGDPVELVAGLQGGWHLDVAVRFGGFGPNGALLVYAARTESGELISYETQALLTGNSVLPDGEGWIRLGDRVVLNIIRANEVVGQTLVLEVTATLGDGTWTDQRRVLVVDEL